MKFHTHVNTGPDIVIKKNQPDGTNGVSYRAKNSYIAHIVGGRQQSWHDTEGVGRPCERLAGVWGLGRLCGLSLINAACSFNILFLIVLLSFSIFNINLPTLLSFHVLPVSGWVLSGFYQPHTLSPINSHVLMFLPGPAGGADIPGSPAGAAQTFLSPLTRPR